MRPRREARLGIALLVLVVVTALGQLHFVNVTFDDAFISFRYAQNLAHGHGLVFNVGERVEGYSNFAWTALLAVPSLLGADRYEFGMLIVAKIAGGLLGLASVLLSYRTGLLDRAPDERASALLAPAYLAVTSPFLLWNVGALETPLVTLLLTLTLYLHLREDERQGPPWSYLALVGAALTRPEPVAFFPLFAGLRLWRAYRLGRPLRRELVFLGWFAVPIGAFLALRVGYYGSFLPNTYFAKVAADRAVPARGAQYLAWASDRLNLTCLALAGLCCLITTRRFSYRLAVLLAFAAVQLGAVYYEGGDWMPGYRLLVPVLPIVGLLLQEYWLAVGGLPAWRRGAVRALLLLIVLLGSVASFEALPTAAFGSGLKRLNLDHGVHFEMARWMRRELSEPGLLALGEAGVVPYYTRLPVLDLYGLNDAHIARLPGEMHHKFDLEYALARDPKYVLLLVRRAPDGRLTSSHEYAQALLDEPRFGERYAPLHEARGLLLYRRRLPGDD